MEWLEKCLAIANKIALAEKDDWNESTECSVIVDKKRSKIIVDILLHEVCDEWDESYKIILSASGDSLEAAALNLEKEYKLMLEKQPTKLHINKIR